MSVWDKLLGRRQEAPMDPELKQQLEEFNARLKREENMRKAAELDAVSVTPMMQTQGVDPGRRVREPVDAFVWHITSYACAQRTATSVSMNRLVCETESGKEIPLARATNRGDFARPNSACTIQEHIDFLVLDLMLSGNSYEYIADDGLWRVNPQRMKIIPGKKNRIDFFEYDAGFGRKLKLDPELVIHRRRPNPVDEYYGIGPGSVALDSVKLDRQMDYYNRRFFEAGQRLGIILETEMELTRAKKRQLAREYVLHFSGVQNMHKAAVLSHGLKAKEAGESHRDLEFNEGKKDIRDAVCMAYLMPPVLISVTESVNYSNARQQLQIYYEFNVLPLMRFLVQGWMDNRVLFPNKDRILRFDEKEIQDRLVDPDIASKAAVALYNSQLYGRNAIRRKFFKDGDMDAAELADVKPSPAPALARTPFSASFSADDARAALRAMAAENRRHARKTASSGASDDEDDKDTQHTGWRILEDWDSKAWGEWALKAQGDKELDLAGRTIAPLLRAQRDRVLDAIKSGTKAVTESIDLDEITAIIRETDPNFAEEMQPEYQAMLEQYGSETFLRLGLDPGTFDVFDEAVVDWAKDRALDFAKDVNITTEGTIRTVLAESFENGDTLDTIAAKVKETYDQWVGEGDAELSKTRAMRIARTETVAAQNAGVQEGFEQSEIVEGKSWMTLGDFKVRDSHVAVDGEVVGLHSKFSNGLKHPGDMTANKPDEVVNCRCTMQPAMRVD